MPAAYWEGLTCASNPLLREEALETVRALPDEVLKDDVYPQLLTLINDTENWAARQASLSIVLAVTPSKLPWSVRKGMYPAFRMLLKDMEVRVRQMNAKCIEACVRLDIAGDEEQRGYVEELYVAIVKDISDNYERYGEVAKEICAGVAGYTGAKRITGLHESEGWRSLETSMASLAGFVRGAGHKYESGRDLDLLINCTHHVNRFVREYAYKSLADIFMYGGPLNEGVRKKALPILKKGLADNWSQVRYVSSVATRTFFQNPGFDLDEAAPFILPYMCLNRHYVAEGVKLYSLESWKLLFPQGGIVHLMKILEVLVDELVLNTNAPNHAVREAACKCVSELANYIAGTPEVPSPFRAYFEDAIITKLIDALLSALIDESWPVRDYAALACGHFSRAFPKEFAMKKNDLLPSMYHGLGDNIPSLRKNMGQSLAAIAKAFEIEEEILLECDMNLENIRFQTAESASFSQYTPSGPFSVPKKRTEPVKHEDYEPEGRFVDQVMYSCGSSAPRNFKKPIFFKTFDDNGGCMNCLDAREHQPWETAEGGIHCLVEMAKLENNIERLDKRLDKIIELWNLNHYPHHCQLKSTICDLFCDLFDFGLVLDKEKLRPIIGPAVDQKEHAQLRVNAEALMKFLTP